MNRKVKSLRTHSDIFAGGSIGSLGDTLPNNFKSVQLDMTATEIGVVVKASTKGSLTKGPGKATILIPYGNIKHCALEDEEESVAQVNVA